MQDINPYVYLNVAQLVLTIARRQDKVELYHQLQGQRKLAPLAVALSNFCYACQSTVSLPAGALFCHFNQSINYI